MRIKLANQYFALNKLWVVVTVTAFAILINLAWWQLTRAEQKEMQLQRLAELQAEGPIGYQQLRELQARGLDIDGMLLQDDGQWLSPYIWLRDNQIVNGRVGYDVIIPVQLAPAREVLLVNLGWIAAPAQRNILPTPEIPASLQITGLLRTEPGGVILGQNVEDNGSWPMRIQQVNFEQLDALMPEPIFPALIYQQQSDHFVSHYQPVVMLPEKHRGYALQWFLLAVAVLGVALAASHQGPALKEKYHNE